MMSNMFKFTLLWATELTTFLEISSNLNYSMITAGEEEFMPGKIASGRSIMNMEMG